MIPMTVKEFDSLCQRDFENGAVKDSIRTALKERESLLTPIPEGRRRIIPCPSCGREWDTKKHSACQCGAIIKIPKVAVGEVLFGKEEHEKQMARVAEDKLNEFVEDMARGIYQTSMTFSHKTPEMIVYQCQKLARHYLDKYDELKERG